MSDEEKKLSGLTVSKFRQLVTEYWKPNVTGLQPTNSMSEPDKSSTLYSRTRIYEVKGVKRCQMAAFLQYEGSKPVVDAMIMDLVLTVAWLDWPYDQPWPTGASKIAFMHRSILEQGAILDAMGIHGAVVIEHATSTQVAGTRFKSWEDIAEKFRPRSP